MSSMVAALAGRYSATYNSLALGQTVDGWRIMHQFFKRLIQGDAGGDTAQNAIYRGREQTLSARMIEAAAAGIPTLIEPYANTPGTPLTLGNIGQLDVGYTSGPDTVPGAAKSIVLTAITNTPSYILGELTITLPLSILAEGFPIEVLLAPDLKEYPLRMRVYPNSSGVFGTVTT